jgi:RNA polymerase-binding transcription factor DksA
MVHNLIRALFSCRHPTDKQSWPITLKDRTYRVCTDCGHELPFDSNAFRPLTRGEIRRLKSQPK